jgi:hypothetical protein
VKLDDGLLHWLILRICIHLLFFHFSFENLNEKVNNHLFQCETIMEEQEENILELFSAKTKNVEFELCQKRSKLCDHLSSVSKEELWSKATKNFKYLFVSPWLCELISRLTSDFMCSFGEIENKSGDKTIDNR